mgnify:CR=1 FL=1
MMADITEVWSDDNPPILLGTISPVSCVGKGCSITLYWEDGSETVVYEFADLLDPGRWSPRTVIKLKKGQNPRHLPGFVKRIHDDG